MSSYVCFKIHRKYLTDTLLQVQYCSSNKIYRSVRKNCTFDFVIITIQMQIKELEKY